MNIDPSRRADLKARIGRARGCLAYAESWIAHCARQQLALRKLAFTKGVGKCNATKFIKAAAFFAASAQSAEAARVSSIEALEAMLAMWAELDEPIKEGTA